MAQRRTPKVCSMKFFSFNYILFCFLKLYSCHFAQFKSTTKAFEYGHMHLRYPLSQGKGRVFRSYFKIFQDEVGGFYTVYNVVHYTVITIKSILHCYCCNTQYLITTSSSPIYNSSPSSVITIIISNFIIASFPHEKMASSELAVAEFWCWKF